MNEKYERILQAQQRDWNRIALRMALLVPVIAACFYHVGLFDEKRLMEGIPSIFGLLIESLPPDFTEVRNWVKPLLDTLAMSVAGTAIAVFFSLPLGLLSARNTSPHPLVYILSRG
ncbi:MAG: PhnE/PtxC family ABC transporter permease, partial [Desulfomonilaceae bacterium]